MIFVTQILLKFVNSEIFAAKFSWSILILSFLWQAEEYAAALAASKGQPVQADIDAVRSMCITISCHQSLMNMHCLLISFKTSFSAVTIVDYLDLVD